MATELSFTWDSRELAVFRGGVIDKAIARALRLAGNQAIRSVRKGATALALSKKNLPEPVITEDQKLVLPGRKEAIPDLVWTLWVKGKPVPASKFPHLDTRRGGRRGRGVLVRFGAGSGTKRFSHAFVATMRSGHVGIFQRRGAARLPIDEAFSSRLPKKYGQDVATTLGEKTYRKLESAFVRGLDRELGKLKRKGEA